MKNKSVRKASYNCVITAYRDIEIAQPLINALLNQEYDRYVITVIADQCPKVNWIYKKKNIKIFYPDKPLNSKLKSIRMALEQVGSDFDYTVIFDPDNMVELNFLSSLNNYHSQYEIVQCRRTAKNLENYISCLDAAGELYKNYVERKAPFLLGSSATIAGSGMSIKSSILKSFLNCDEVLSKIDGVILGEDKMLQNYIVFQNKVIAFEEEVLVFDEKVISSKQVKRQRTRWINAYFQNVFSSSRIFLQSIKNRSVNQFLFSINSLIPPLFLLTTTSLALIFLNAFIYGLEILFFIQFIGLLFFSANFLLVLKLYNAPSTVLRALFFVPVFIFNQILALFNIKKTKNDFLVTKKKGITSSSIK